MQPNFTEAFLSTETPSSPGTLAGASEKENEHGLCSLQPRGDKALSKPSVLQKLLQKGVVMEVPWQGAGGCCPLEPASHSSACLSESVQLHKSFLCPSSRVYVLLLFLLSW